MEKIHGNTHVFVLSCKFVTCKHKNMRVSMYFLQLELTFTPHYIITDKGLLKPGYDVTIIKKFRWLNFRGPRLIRKLCASKIWRYAVVSNCLSFQ